MATIDAKTVNDLRLETGAGMMDCKKALEEASGDKTKAKEILKKKGLEKAENIAAKGAGSGGPKEGRIGTYIHSTGKVAAMVELNCDTDFVAKNEEFQALMKDLAVAVCAFEPIAVSKDQVPADVVEAEKAKYANDVKGKPPEIAAKIIDGKMEKNLYAKIPGGVLLSMPYPKEDEFKGTYGDLLKSKVAKLKENIQLRRFVRMEVGK
ncbi:MAG TPA: elongation factor Ts [Planctomycetota bacterium]|nr:elongation factor Ts [Planctomycetota bacterium]